MGLDIYAGTMTRYYAHNWKTVTEQWAEENGYTFHRITPGGDGISDNETISPAEIQAGIKNWQEQMLSAITQPGQKPYAPWAEDNEKPYYTDKPDWDAFVAMLLVAACLVYGEPIPDTIEKDHGFQKIRKRSGRCFEERPAGFHFRTASYSRRQCQTAIKR